MTNKPLFKIHPDGTKYWYLNGVLHRVDGPAVEKPDGYKAWWLNGKRHRVDGPAVERPDGIKAWHLNGVLHRVDGPAMEYSDGSKDWYLNGVLHRVDGPAVERPDGYKAWYLNGKRHRVDGPAIEWSDGYKAWYLNGKQCTKELHKTLTQSPARDLLLYLRQGYDEYIEQRLRKAKRIYTSKPIYVSTIGELRHATNSFMDECQVTRLELTYTLMDGNGSIKIRTV